MREWSPLKGARRAAKPRWNPRRAARYPMWRARSLIPHAAPARRAEKLVTKLRGKQRKTAVETAAGAPGLLGGKLRVKVRGRARGGAEVTGKVSGKVWQP